jgi:hypothetical protein
MPSLDACPGVDPAGFPMHRLRFQFSLRLLAIAIALVGMNLAAAISVSRKYPRKISINSFSYERNLGTRIARSRAELMRLFPVRVSPVVYEHTLFEIWSPIIASMSVTLLILGFVLGREFLRGRKKSSVRTPPVRG